MFGRIKIREEKKTISYIILHRDRFKVDKTYQREKVWSRSLKQYLIDTIIRGYDIGQIYLNEVTENEGDVYYIIDGQQRLSAIWEFYDNKFPLGEYSADLGLNGKFYRELPREIKDEFDQYNIALKILQNANDEQIRDIYRRVNSGVPLNTGERLNALPGKIVPTTRELANHDFLRDICGLKRRKRYRALHIAAQILLLEYTYLNTKGYCDISPKNLYEFFDKHRDLDSSHKVVKKIIKTFNFLKRSFKVYTPELSKPGWIISTYLLASYIIDNYVVTQDIEKAFRNFIINFHNEVINAEVGKSPDYLMKFKFAISRGTTSLDNIKKRHEIILTEFLRQNCNIIPLDPKREYTQFERIVIFRKFSGKCALCGRELNFDKSDWHIHHRIPWSRGGRSTIDNALLVCENCHRKLHTRRIDNS